jgi:hypothetical protein
MPFGLSNALACFQQFVNDIFRDLIDRGVLVYLDNILVYLDTQAEQDWLVKEVLAQLSKYALYAKITKCKLIRCKLSSWVTS